MFFSSRKKKRLAEAQAQEQEQARLKQEAAIQEAYAYHKNISTFYRICDMVRSLPKERQIVVVQRKNEFSDNHHRNACYLKLAEKMRSEHRRFGKTWMHDEDNCLYAFYAPTKLDYNFRQTLKEFSKGGYLIHRIRYYHFNY